MTPSEINLDELVCSVLSSRYTHIDPTLVRRIVEDEVSKGHKPKEIIKAARSKLHQVAVSYQEKPIPYVNFSDHLKTLPVDISAPEMKDFCRQVLAYHASTAERLPVLEEFYGTIFKPLMPVNTLLDLACGLNPFTRPWMPLDKETVYLAGDIFSDLVGFVNLFFNHLEQKGRCEIIDLCGGFQLPPVDVALLLKSVPCLEQLDKHLFPGLLGRIPAKHIIISFPVQSLGGKQKGMLQYYRSHFDEMVKGLPFFINTHLFKTELVYTLSRIDK